MSDPPLRVGVAGLGLGARFMLPWIRRDTRFRIVAGADQRAAARRGFAAAFDARTYDDVELLCDDPEIDLVYVATPHHLHHDHAVAAVSRGRHVLVEKPLARTVAQAEAIVAAADAAGVQALYGHSHAYDPAIVELSRLASTGAFGALGSVLTFNYNDVLYRPRASWELDPVVSGGTPFIQGAHQVDLVRAIAASPMTAVDGWSTVLDPGRGVPGSHGAVLAFESGAHGTIVFNGYGHFDSAEWLGRTSEGGGHRREDTHATTLTRYRDGGRAAEDQARDARRVGTDALPPAELPSRQENFGVTIATFERADVRTTGTGLAIHGELGPRHVELAPSTGRSAVLDAVHAAVVGGVRSPFDAGWAVDTVRACEAMAGRSTGAGLNR